MDIREEKMYDEYQQVINCEETYKTIAKELMDCGKCIIGWTDQGYDHRDIMFVYKPRKYGYIQRGLKEGYLYVGIMDFSCMGLPIEYGRVDNTLHPSYIMEKLRLHDNHCDNKICELINGVISQMDAIRE